MPLAVLLVLNCLWHQAQAAAKSLRGPTAGGDGDSSVTSLVYWCLLTGLAVSAFVLALNVSQRQPDADRFDRAKRKCKAALRELKSRYDGLLVAHCDYFISFVDQFHPGLPVFTVVFLFLLCRVPRGRGHHDISLFQSSDSDDDQSIIGCATSLMVKMLDKVFPSVPISFRQTKMKLKFGIIQTPRRCCPIKTPDPGQLYDPCPAWRVPECRMIAELVNILLTFFGEIGFPVLLFGAPGLGSKLEENLYPLLETGSTDATLGPCIDHPNNWYSFCRGYSNPTNQQAVVSSNFTRLSNSIGDHYARRNAALSRSLMSIGTEEKLARYVQPTNKLANTTLLMAKQHTVDDALKVQQALRASDGSPQSLQAIADMLNTTHKGTPRSVSDQSRTLRKFVKMDILTEPESGKLVPFLRSHLRKERGLPPALRPDKDTLDRARRSYVERIELLAEEAESDGSPQSLQAIADALGADANGKPWRGPALQHQCLTELLQDERMSQSVHDQVKVLLKPDLDTLDMGRAAELETAVFVNSLEPGSSILQDTVDHLFKRDMNAEQQHSRLDRLLGKGLLSEDDGKVIRGLLSEIREAKRKALQEDARIQNPRLARHDF